MVDRVNVLSLLIFAGNYLKIY